MDTQPPVPAPRRAWHPLTARGVAAFAEATTRRLWLVQWVFAFACTAAVGWFLTSAWFPVIRSAAEKLPEDGLIRAGTLDWRGPAPVLLAENAFLAIAADPDHTGKARSPAHLYVELGRRNVLVFSLFGYVPAAYPAAGTVGFGRDEVRAWWGAWSPFLLVLTCGATAVALMASWTGLAWIYTVPVWLAAFLLNRRCSLRGAWRLAGAAQMPGALFMSATIVLHGLGGLDVVRVLICFGAHFLVSWVYLGLGIVRLPPVASAVAAQPNPFRPEPPADKAESAPAAPEPGPASPEPPPTAAPAPAESDGPNPFRRG